ncbi:hypothetical protein ACFQFQ_25110 [Sulfitobacter porphyrae]|uniref:Uncharacterized protein n=1 Tax=Sulfitobacter porphyrae TaxID=1246864 RepID=A0ABW2B901_9RHOB
MRESFGKSSILTGGFALFGTFGSSFLQVSWANEALGDASAMAAAKEYFGASAQNSGRGILGKLPKTQVSRNACEAPNRASRLGD